MERLLQPHSTAAIILGAYDWTKAGLARAPSFRRSAHHYHAYLLDREPSGLGLQPDLVLNLFDDRAAANDQLTHIADWLRSWVLECKATGLALTDVLIYYVGHGTFDATSRQLHLLTHSSVQSFEEQTSIGASSLAQVLRLAAPQQRRIVILDCCFSSAAVDAFMGNIDETVATTAIRNLEPDIPPPDRGTVLLCSSPRNDSSIGVPNAERTLFTGALLAVLKEGSPSRQSQMLSFVELREDVYDNMLRFSSGDHPPPRPALHQPDQQAGDLTRIPAFPNVAWHLRAVQEQARREAEEQARLKVADQLREAEAQTRRDAEEQAQREAKEQAQRAAEEQARREAEEQAQREAEEQAQRVAEEQARLKSADQRSGAEKQARRTSATRIRRTAVAQARRAVEEQARRDAEERAREAEEQARREALEDAEGQKSEVQNITDETPSIYRVNSKVTFLYL
jgi:hypothetical protein